MSGFFSYSNNVPLVITTRPLDVSEQKIVLPNGCYYDLIQTSSKPRILDVLNDESLIYQLLYRDLRKSLQDSGFDIRGNSAFKQLESLDINFNSSNSFVQQIVEHIKIHPGFYYRLRTLNSKLFLQITPKSIIEFNSDLYTLMKDNNFSEHSLEYLCQRVRLHNNKTAYLRSILDKTCSVKLNESPYNGDTYIDYASKTGDSHLTQKDARLILVQEKYRNQTGYSSTELAKPIIDFTSLSHLDPDIHSTINEKLKRQSAQRRNLAIKYAGELHLIFDGKPIGIGPRSVYRGSYSNPINLFMNLFSDQFLFFRSPIVSFRDINGEIKNASKDTGDVAAPQDLLRNKGYRPFLSPKSLKITILTFEGLESEAQKLKSALLNDDPSKTLVLQQILNCKFSIGEILTISREDASVNLPVIDADCAVVVGKKDETDSYGIKSSAYVDIEVALLRRGIPTQYVIHDPVKQYGITLENKIAGPYSFLGIAISILTKVGGSSMVISEKTIDGFLVNSTVLGYNFTRVFPPIEDRIKKMDSVLDFTKTSIPLSASISIMDQIGSEIIHQYPHVIPNENSLFSGEGGQMIFDNIPDTYTNIIVHKDGFFSKSELEDLRKLKRKHVGLFPISIVTNEVPRISASESNYLPKDGTCIPLSQNEFLLSTTLTPEKYDPNKKGWPNPLFITIHKLPNQNLSTPIKLRILSQIWALTRSHPASMNPTRRPMSIHYSNKIGQFIRKARDPEPSYFKEIITGKKNRLGLYPKPFI